MHPLLWRHMAVSTTALINEMSHSMRRGEFEQAINAGPGYEASRPESLSGHEWDAQRRDVLETLLNFFNCPCKENLLPW